MAGEAKSSREACIFCDIVAGRAEASVVFEDETVVAFMDRYPATRGHVLIVPRLHAEGLEDLDAATGAHVWSVGHQLARALRRSGIRCEGVNVLVCDGEAALQTVFHFHLHVIPRYASDGWTLSDAASPQRDRALLDADANSIKSAITSTR